MKLNKVYALAKKYREVEIIRVADDVNGGEIQWISLLCAAYPLRGFPVLRTRDEVLALLDVPADEADSWTVTITTGHGEWAKKLFERIDPDEDPLRVLPFGLTLGGDGITVFDGGAMVKDKFLSPAEFDRVTECGSCLRVFRGAQLEAVIGKYIPSEEQIEEVVPILHYLEHCRERLLYERAMAIRMEEEDEDRDQN